MFIIIEFVEWFPTFLLLFPVPFPLPFPSVFRQSRKGKLSVMVTANRPALSPQPELTPEAVKYAIDIGYRHLDCAPIYGNEKEVGSGIKAKIEDGTVQREDLFIVSKLWSNSHKVTSVEKALKKSLVSLGLDYLDLYLIHWPFAVEDGDDFVPQNPDGTPKLSDIDYLETWKGMEGVLQKGLTKNIGVSNFNSEQIERLLENCQIKPVVNQVEVHPYLSQKELSKFCNDRGIMITAYSPLGAPNRFWAKPDDAKILEDDKLVEMGKKYNKTSAQIAIRYQLDRGHLAIPKSVTKARILENSQVFDFTLSSKDIEYINSLGSDERLCEMADYSGSPHWPFKIPY
ncbi:aldo-keto reductase family 1 member B1-like isoform X2 [Diachasmimorpha longicaudata]|uniref:aldo-keto reductase family 1 member B1-like isoform X2 n=1 Tax=Diachasmimorpha longicaudata TaxID=58733 RepID=UPI0030B8A2BD